jgi:hypothetical protein
VTSRHERGSAVVEFTLVSIVLITLFLAIVQLGLVLHVRNTLVAAASEGARHAASANLTLGDGELRTRELIAESLSADLAQGVTSRVVDVGGVEMVEIEVTATLPLFGLLGVERGLIVTGHAVDEESL